MNIFTASKEDLLFLKEHDRHIKESELESIIKNGRIYTCKENGKILGWLRWGLFWDNTPFMNMLYVLPPHRGRGIGGLLTRHWESHMKSEGYSTVMTSALSNEQAQHFYRKSGYRDAGSLILSNEPLEIIFTKTI